MKPQYLYKKDPLFDALQKSGVTQRLRRPNIFLKLLESALSYSYNVYSVECRTSKKSVMTFPFHF